eukprot:TRINITY_DN672_c0_g1_i11.p2 TRINITY_DN672_c0_g1~~TRINITY_DN672_c0_g1_i11.p2  ORF type:complete len:113 (-),score=16.12 TRINITY_DN672_c0_g1_i11:468-806(-)
MSELVFHSINLHESATARRIRAQSDPWCRFNPTLQDDLATLLTARSIKSFLSTIVEKLKLELEIQVMVCVHPNYVELNWSVNSLYGSTSYKRIDVTLWKLEASTIGCFNGSL